MAEDTANDPAQAQALAQDAALQRSSSTRREDVVETLHGVEVADPYRWLEDVNAPEVKAWVAAHDAKARNALAKLPGRSTYLKRLHALTYIDSESPPVIRNQRAFFSRKAATSEKPIYYWRSVEAQRGERNDERNDERASAPKVLIDPLKLDASGAVSVSSVIPSYDGRWVAYMEKESNRDESTLTVRSVDTNEVASNDRIPGQRYTEASWTPDNLGFFYTWLPSDPNIPPNELMGHGEIRYHRLGTDPAHDEIFRGPTHDPSRFMQAEVSSDGRYLFATISRGWAEQDVYVMALFEKARTWRPLAVGTKALYQIRAYRDIFYVATNEGAARWQIYAVRPEKLERKAWRRIIPEDRVRALDSFSILGGHLVVNYWKNAASEIAIFALSGKPRHVLGLPSLGTASPLLGEEEADEAYFSFTSFTFPEEIYRASIRSGRIERVFKSDAPIDPSPFVVEQKFFPSKDGTSVPMFLVHRADLKTDGTTPTILYGYGGFNIPLTPRFSALIYAFVEEGGLYAMPNLRGGGEFGEDWHRAGMLDKKQNVFDDFLKAADWLAEQRYTSPEHLAVMGRSNGGLLVGAAMTQGPSKMAAVVCGVPLLDMVRYPKFGIGPAWIPEYGDPEKPDDFAWLYAYSPYHHVIPGTDYPALLLLSADTDDRVDPMHARKFYAAIQSATRDPSAKDLLLRVERESGHGGADLRAKSIEENADVLAFLRSVLVPSKQRQDQAQTQTQAQKLN
ncbi:MAG: S9 family peptidase [Deltaproteobacteria bacterium]|nr:S9 family peptidase [Deltaproteobacteria bacterium]